MHITIGCIECIAELSCSVAEGRPTVSGYPITCHARVIQLLLQPEDYKPSAQSLRFGKRTSNDAIYALAPGAVAVNLVYVTPERWKELALARLPPDRSDLSI
jgi:hypothetical protein